MRLRAILWSMASLIMMSGGMVLFPETDINNFSEAAFACLGATVCFFGYVMLLAVLKLFQAWSVGWAPAPNCDHAIVWNRKKKQWQWGVRPR
jgi:hypothetical protein